MGVKSADVFLNMSILLVILSTLSYPSLIPKASSNPLCARPSDFSHPFSDLLFSKATVE